jgi:hypothetical protein
MGALPVLQPVETPAHEINDETTLRVADQDERVVNRLGAARGMIGGMVVGAFLWAALIVAGTALLRR